MLDILHCTPECVPYSKTGGLADVSGALPEALTRLGHRVAVVTPLYASVDRDRHRVAHTGREVQVTLAGRTFDFEVHETTMPAGTRVLFLANEGLFGRPQLYGTREGDYPDNHLRFGAFAAAVFGVVRALRLRPDVLHCHDWQAGLVPAWNHLHLDLFATVTTIHNMAYQGLFSAEVLPDVGLPWELFNPEQVEFWGKVGFLKAGLVFADRITTVSPRYAREIMTPEFGCGLDGLLRRRGADVSGILNGADYGEWSPATDALIPSTYSAADLSGKAACREALLRECGLAPARGPVFGVVGRLAEQKGFDLLACVLPDVVALGASVVVLGTGEAAIEDHMVEVASRYPERVAVRIAYDNGLAHRIEAGCDFFVMPSRYEPCGLNQIYSMAYGTLPVVHAVGGLDDTVADVDEDPANATGLKFRTFTREALLDRLARAVTLHADAAAHAAVVRRAMAADFSWDASARAYEALYAGLVSAR
ncbi:MAG: glycogen synthase GlgA [Deltaproteobacteria bacterium]|nr:glycogen synthase GlgA [Deltaproteobacteria bacterium]